MKLKYIKKNRFDYHFLNIENEEEVILKIWTDKEFRDKINTGDIGEAEINGDWLNKWDFEKNESNKSLQENTSLEESKPTQATPGPIKKKLISPYDIKNDAILDQVCLKAAVEVSKDIKEIKNNTIELFNFMKQRQEEREQ